LAPSYSKSKKLIGKTYISYFMTLNIPSSNLIGNL